MTSILLNLNHHMWFQNSFKLYHKSENFWKIFIPKTKIILHYNLSILNVYVHNIQQYFIESICNSQNDYIFNIKNIWLNLLSLFIFKLLHLIRLFPQLFQFFAFLYFNFYLFLAITYILWKLTIYELYYH